MDDRAIHAAGWRLEKLRSECDGETMCTWNEINERDIRDPTHLGATPIDMVWATGA